MLGDRRCRRAWHTLSRLTARLRAESGESGDAFCSGARAGTDLAGDRHRHLAASRGSFARTQHGARDELFAMARGPLQFIFKFVSVRPNSPASSNYGQYGPTYSVGALLRDLAWRRSVAGCAAQRAEMRNSITCNAQSHEVSARGIWLGKACRTQRWRQPVSSRCLLRVAVAACASPCG